MIRKEAYVHGAVMDELRRIIEDSEIMAEDDALWPQPDRVGRQVSFIQKLGIRGAKWPLFLGCALHSLLLFFM